MFELAIVVAATVLVGWIVSTLVSISKSAGATEERSAQAAATRKKLTDATNAGIAARDRDDHFGGLRESDGHRRD